MKRMLYMFLAVWGMCWMVSSCSTLRKKMKSTEQHRFAYTHTALASDSAVRYWYFASDSAFAYHPDSGLRTFSGRLLGWELSVNHQLVQETRDSTSEWNYNEREVVRGGAKSRWMGYALVTFIAIIAFAGFWMAKKGLKGLR